MNTPVLLTGATGYIGGRLLRDFEEAGQPVRWFQWYCRCYMGRRTADDAR